MAITVRVAKNSITPVNVALNDAVSVNASGWGKVFGGFDGRLWKPYEQDGNVAWELSTNMTPPEPVSFRENLEPDGNLEYTDDGKLSVRMAQSVNDNNRPVSAKLLSEVAKKREVESMSNSDIESLLNLFV